MNNAAIHSITFCLVDIAVVDFTQDKFLTQDDEERGGKRRDKARVRWEGVALR